MKIIEIDEYRKIITQVLLKIDKICQENGLKYGAYAGTLLGSIRHKGFIPWDDDIDIIMTRDNYNKLAEIINSHPEYGLNFIRPEEYPDTVYAYGKVCDTSTEVIETGVKRVDGYGAFVDVFPLDYLPEDPKQRLKLKKKFLRKMRVLYAASIEKPQKAKGLKGIYKLLIFIYARLFSRRKLVKRLNDGMVKLNDKYHSEYMGVVWGRTYFTTWEMSNTEQVDFEGYKIYSPGNPKVCLTRDFGDYMKLPPKEEQILRHGLVCYYKNEKENQ